MDDFVRDVWTCRDSLRRFALRLTGNSADSDDLVQETLIAAISGRDTFRGESALKTWLYAILWNKYLVERRRLGRDRLVFGDAYEDAMLNFHEATDEPDDIDLEWLKTVLTWALRNLTAKHAHVLTENLINGREYREIAKESGVPESTVKTRAFYGRRRLNKLLEPLHGKIPPNAQVARR